MAVAAARIPSRLLAHRSLCSLTSPPINLADKLHGDGVDGGALPPTPPARPLDLADTERLFASIPTAALAAALASLSALALDPLVDLATAAMRSPVVMGTRIGRAAVAGAARATVYSHFCAGEEAEEAAATVRRLWTDAGLRGILDYAVEDEEDTGACDRNLAGFRRTVEVAAALPPSSASVCVKITAICPIRLLEKISNLLRWKQKDPSLHLPWKAHSFPVLTDSSPLFLTPSMPQPLTDTEEHELHLACQRLTQICESCANCNLTLLVDAEYTAVQPAIDYFTYLASLRFNVDQKPVVYGTVQAYLIDARERLTMMARTAEREKMLIGVKLVRGAYLTREIQLASAFGAPSPIHGSIQETHRCYNDCASFLLEGVRRQAAAVVLATHNVESGQLAAAKAEELGIGKGDQRLQFAQLMGMADGLSLGLRNAGFQVSKYLPFGHVDYIIPYLLRRAEENRGFLSTSSLDRQLLRKELKRRLKTALIGGI